MNRHGKQVSALVSAALALLLTMGAVPVYADDAADEIASLNSKYADLQAQQNKINAELGLVKNEKQRQIEVKSRIVEQVTNTTEQIDVLAARISLLGERFDEKQLQLADKQQEIDESFALLKTRMRAMYMAGGKTSTIGMVLGADSFSQFLMRAEMTTRVAKYDQDLIAKLNREKQELEQIKESIAADKAIIESGKAAMDEKKGELDAQMVLAQDKIMDITAMEQEFLSDKAAMQKQMAQLQAEIGKIYAEINKTSTKLPYVGGIMRWPSDKLTQIYSEYGSRFGGTNNHTGIDIAGAGAFGSPVLAANTGTVAVANLNYVPGKDYGKYVIIDHGDGVQTLYAHCNALNVRVGQVVAKGEKIAEVGMTGWATGPHIHFEVRKNGKDQNPINWL